SLEAFALAVRGEELLRADRVVRREELAVRGVERGELRGVLRLDGADRHASPTRRKSTNSCDSPLKRTESCETPIRSKDAFSSTRCEATLSTNVAALTRSNRSSPKA